MRDADVQQAITVDLVQYYDLDTHRIHHAYRLMGGMCTEAEVRRYLAGVAGVPALQRDLIAHTINEHLDDLHIPIGPRRAPYSSARIAAAGGYASSEFDGERLMDHRRCHHAHDRGTSCQDVPAHLPGSKNTQNMDREAKRVLSLSASGLLERPVTGYLGALPHAAREYFGVGYAGCTLITEDTLITKSFTDLPEMGVPREVTFCDQTIRSDKTLIVLDTHRDPRFKDSPLVTGPPFTRFYAGHPIHGPGGSRIGALCIVDDRPRVFTAADEHKLRTLTALLQLDIWAPAA